jgi:hypothetical protein
MPASLRTAGRTGDFVAHLRTRQRIGAGLLQDAIEPLNVVSSRAVCGV